MTLYKVLVVCHTFMSNLMNTPQCGHVIHPQDGSWRCGVLTRATGAGLRSHCNRTQYVWQEHFDESPGSRGSNMNPTCRGFQNGWVIWCGCQVRLPSWPIVASFVLANPKVCCRTMTRWSGSRLKAGEDGGFFTAGVPFIRFGMSRKGLCLKFLD